MIENYLNQTIQIKAKTAFDSYGKPTFGTASNIQARFKEETRRLKDSNGSEIVIDAELWVLPTQTINIEDVIIVESVNYKVVKVASRRDINGAIDHKKAYLVRTKE